MTISLRPSPRPVAALLAGCRSEPAVLLGMGKDVNAENSASAPSRDYGATNTPTNPTPVPPPEPDTIAVYAPGGSVAMIAGSRMLFGWKPAAWIAATSVGT